MATTYRSSLSRQAYDTYVNCYRADLEWATTKVELAHQLFCSDRSSESKELLVAMCNEWDQVAGILADLIVGR